MASPSRFTSGFTQAAKFQPLGEIGAPDPFFYAMYEDDFLPYRAGDYTVTAATGTAAGTSNNGTGGRVLLSTTAAINDFVSLQQAQTNFAWVAGKKLAYACRINLADVVNSRVLVGLIQSTATPFTVVNGIYFLKSPTSNTITLNVVSASTLIGSVTMPSLAGSTALTNGTDQDLGFYIDRSGNLKAFCGYSLFGVKRQNFTVLGPEAGILNSALTGSITTLPLTPTLAVQASTAAIQTMAVDFQYAAQER